MSELALSDKVDALESLILQVPQVDLQTKHELSGGVYARTILIPEGTVLTGARHKKDHVNIVFGDITVSTDDGMTWNPGSGAGIYARVGAAWVKL